MKTSERELIMAYHDGELPLGQRIEVELWLDTRPEARAYLDELQATDRHYRAGLDALLAQKSAESVTGSLGATSSTPGVEDVTGKIVRFPFPGLWGQNWALAASLVLALVLGGGWWLQFQQDAGQSTLAQALNSALETTPSGEVYQGPGEALQIMPLASYHTERQGLCREYAGRYQARQLFGLACRREGGNWTPVFEQSNELTPAGEADNTYLAASGRKDHFAEQLDAMGAGQALTAEREAQLIAEQWR